MKRHDALEPVRRLLEGWKGQEVAVDFGSPHVGCEIGGLERAVLGTTDVEETDDIDVITVPFLDEAWNLIGSLVIDHELLDTTPRVDQRHIEVSLARVLVTIRRLPSDGSSATPLP